MGRIVSARTSRADYFRPSHFASTSIFSVWNDEPFEINELEFVWTKWTRNYISTHGDPDFQPGSRYHKAVCGWGGSLPHQVLEMELYYSLDKGESWKKIEFMESSYYFKPNKNAGAEEKNFNELIEKSKKEFKRQRAKNLAKKRKAKYEKEAAKLGVTLEEYKQMRSNKNKEKKKTKAALKDVELVKKKMKLGPVLTDLKEEVDSLINKLADPESNIKLGYLDNKIRHLKTAIYTLKGWQR